MASPIPIFPMPTAPTAHAHAFIISYPLFLMRLFFICSAQLYVLCSYQYYIVFLSGATNGENDYEPGLPDFDPIKHHNSYCPWVNGTVAAACCYDTSSGSSELSGWQLTVDALDTFQSLGQSQIQTMQSESAASLNMVTFVMLIFFIFFLLAPHLNSP